MEVAVHVARDWQTQRGPVLWAAAHTGAETSTPQTWMRRPHFPLPPRLLLSAMFLHVIFFYSLLFKCSDERRSQADSSGNWRSLLVINVDTPPFFPVSLSQRNPSALKILILITLISTLILSSFLFIWIISTNNKEMSSVVFSSTILAKTRQALDFVSPGLADGFFFSLFENNWVQKDGM